MEDVDPNDLEYKTVGKQKQKRKMKLHIWRGQLGIFF